MTVKQKIVRGPAGGKWRESAEQGGSKATVPKSASSEISAPKSTKKPNDINGRKGQFFLTKKLWWVKVDAATWKLTDGKIFRVPAVRGMWGGYEAERGVAWAIYRDWPGEPAWWAYGGGRKYKCQDFDDARGLARSLAEAAPLGEPTDNFSKAPLNIVGGHKWSAVQLAPNAVSKILQSELGGERRESADIIPPPDNTESLNTCADDTWIDWPADDEAAPC